MRRLALAIALGVVLLAGVGVALVLRWQRADEARPAAATDAADAVGVRQFRLVLAGEECAGVSVLCLRRDLPAEGVLVVTRSADGTVTHERRFSDDHLESQTFTDGPDGLVLAEQRQDVSFAGMRRDERDVPEPAPLLFPATMAVGERWQASYALRKLQVTTASDVVGTETVDVDGQEVDTYVIEQHTTSSGPFEGDERVRIWWAPSLAMPVRRTIERKLSGSFAYQLELDERLASTEPIDAA